MTKAIALVTGASSGIGNATAHALAGRGYDVYAGARKRADLDRLSSEGFHAVELDVTDEASILAAVRHVEEARGSVDVLINNAGYGQMGAVEEVTLDQWRRQFETNVFGLVRVTQAVLPGMRRAGRGRIVNIGSMGGEFTFPLGAAYHSTKYAVESISDALRFEVAAFGIDVILIQPGVVATALATSTVESIATSENSPYARLVAGFRQGAEAQMGPDAGVLQPEEVAAEIVAAVTADPVPTRVKIGAMAAQMTSARRSMSDRDWDAMLAPMFGLTPIPA